MPKPWPLVGPIRSGASPFVETAERAYCPTCMDETDVETAVGTAGGVNVYRRRCRRCGRVLAHGIDRAALTTPLPPAALAFVRARGPNRS